MSTGKRIVIGRVRRAPAAGMTKSSPSTASQYSGWLSHQAASCSGLNPGGSRRLLSTLTAIEFPFMGPHVPSSDWPDQTDGPLLVDEGEIAAAGCPAEHAEPVGSV